MLKVISSLIREFVNILAYSKQSDPIYQKILKTYEAAKRGKEPLGFLEGLPLAINSRISGWKMQKRPDIAKLFEGIKKPIDEILVKFDKNKLETVKKTYEENIIPTIEDFYSPKR